MKKKMKKAFTLVELLVVIAILAVLSTVAIVGYNSFTEKAQRSADEQAVVQMNRVLDANEALEGKPENIIEVAQWLSAAGINSEKGITPLMKNHYFYWFKTANEIVYVDESNGGFELIYPKEVEGFPASKTTDIQPLAAAIDAVLGTPVVEETTAVVDGSVTTTTLPAEVTDFNSLMSWLSNDTDKGLKCTVNGAQKHGIVFPSGEVKLTEDIILDTTNITNTGNTLVFNIVEDTTIDLNGHKIVQYGSGLSLSLFSVRAGATLNIIDSSSEQTGAIYASYTAFQIDTGATVNLYGGTIDVTDDAHRGGNATSGDLAYGCELVFLWGGTFNMYGGKLDADVEQEFNTAIGTQYLVNSSACYLYAGEIIGDVQVTNVPTFFNYGAKITGEIIAE